MLKRMLWIAAVTLLLASTLFAQDIAGDWQGTLKVEKDLRIVLQIAKAENGGWNATLYSLDQGREGIRANAVTLQGSSLKVTIDALGGTYEGKVSPDAASIQGTWTQGVGLPLELRRASKETAWLQGDRSPHTLQFITVDKNVKLEVLDWGGSGRPVVLLAGLGNTAHAFDEFAPKLTGAYHVFGITRRGFGASSVPDSGYSADRLGDDVLAVVDSLKLSRPVLVGHSIAGEELSSVGSRHPEKVAGLIYLDAGYSYAYYDRSRGDLTIDSLELQKKLEQLLPGSGPQDQKQLVQELLQTSLPQLEKDLKALQKDLDTDPAPSRAPAQQAVPRAPTPAQRILAGQQRYTDIRVPVLAIFALPHERPPAVGNNAAARAAAEATDLTVTAPQAKAFESGVPSARVVRLANANHFVFRSNEADVLREMNAFLTGLPKE